MENAKEERVRLILYKKFCDVVEEVKKYDLDPLASRDFMSCSSGTREVAISVASVVDSGNQMTDRLIIVFGTLLNEVELLIQQAKTDFLDSLILYGEDPENILENDGGSVKMIADFLETLQDLNLFVTRCYEVVANILRQLHAFFNLPESSLNRASDRTMTRVWKSIGDLMIILVQIDEIIRTHPTLTEHWAIYAKTMRMVQHNPAQFNAVDERFQSLCSMIGDIEIKVMSGFIFQNCCEQSFPVELKQDKPFLQRFQKILSEFLTKWEKESMDDWPSKNQLISIMALTILFTKISPNVDKKFVKNLCSTYKKLSSFQIAGDVYFVPVEFLIRHFPDAEKMAEKKILQNVANSKDSNLAALCEALPKELNNFTDAVSQWKTEMKQVKVLHDFQNNTHQFLSSQCMLVLKGAKIADRISRLVKSVLSGHLNNGKTLLKSNVLIIFRMIELVKVVVAVAKFYWSTILEWCCHATQYWSGCILRILEGIRSQTSTEVDVKILDWTSVLMVAENAVSISPGKMKWIICGVALEVGNYSKMMKGVDSAELDDLLSRLEAIGTIGAIFNRVTNCSFLYWHRSLFQVYFESVFDDSNYSIEQLKLLMDAIQDCSPYLNNAKHCNVEKLKQIFKTEIYDLIEKNILETLCTRIENDLRLDVHRKQHQTVDELESKLFPTNKKTKSSNLPIPNQSETLRCKYWLQLGPFKVVDDIIDIKRYVEIHLEKTFYNLTAVALHDGEIYAKMRQLARHRYGLNFAESKLPYMTVDQGLDILMIMKNLHVFVANYNYDLNEQMFVERTGKNRTLNVMYVQQVVNSIKTHGVGVVNSAVDYSYQFLKKKFHVFSQFLFDDQIKCQLVKEIRFYRDSIDELNQMYPVKRAERFNAAIAKLGVSPDGKTFLDKFRQLITQIGNTIGFIRMIRSGVVESSAYASHFIPKLNLSRKTIDGIPDDPTQNPTISDLCKKMGASDLSVKIAESVDSLISNLADVSSNENDYVEMLISVFAKEFRNYDKFAHLRNFFIIVPPLTINYVEYILTCRSKLGRRTQADNDFTFIDDGFCLGIAYILTLLNQTYFFDSLNWFDSVFDKFDTEIGRAQEEQKAAQKRKDDSFAQTLAIKIQRLQDLHKEFQFLMFTMHSATMLFKIKDQDNSEDEMYLEDF